MAAQRPLLPLHASAIAADDQSMAGEEALRGCWNVFVTMALCTETSAASWLVDSQVSWQQLVTFGPAGLPAYARLRFLPDPTARGQRESEAIVRPDALTEGEQLHAVLAHLVRHTTTPDECYFCLWDGWGIHPVGDAVADPQPRPRQQVDSEPRRDAAPIWKAPGTAQPGLRPASMQSTRRTYSAAMVKIPNRGYYLFRGAWSDFGDWGALQCEDESRDWTPEPAFIWPADHAWCIARDADPHYAGIGASPSARQDLVDDPRLDVVPADPLQESPRYV